MLEAGAGGAQRRSPMAGAAKGRLVGAIARIVRDDGPWAPDLARPTGRRWKPDAEQRKKCRRKREGECRNRRCYERPTPMVKSRRRIRPCEARQSEEVARNSAP